MTSSFNASPSGSQLPAEHTVAGLLEQNITLMMKIVNKLLYTLCFVYCCCCCCLQLQDVQSHHPIGFVSFITPSLQLIYSILFEPSNEGIIVVPPQMKTLFPPCILIRAVSPSAPDRFCVHSPVSSSRSALRAICHPVPQPFEADSTM